MNNKDKYKASIEKINIDENLVNEMIKKVKERNLNVIKNEELNIEKDVENNMKNNSSKGKILKFVRAMSISVAAMFVIVAVGTVGYAMVTGDTRILKTIGINSEGMEENIEVAENNTDFESGVSYTIDYEASMVLRKEKNVDIYESPYNDTMENLKVYMKIYSVNDNECKDLSNELEKEINKYKNEVGVVRTKEVTIGKNGYKAMFYCISDFKSWDSEVKDVYVINVAKNKNLIIELSYWWEAAEGWGTTMGYLLDTLEIKDYNPEVKENEEIINSNVDVKAEKLVVDVQREGIVGDYIEMDLCKGSYGYTMYYPKDIFTFKHTEAKDGNLDEDIFDAKSCMAGVYIRKENKSFDELRASKSEYNVTTLNGYKALCKENIVDEGFIETIYYVSNDKGNVCEIIMSHLDNSEAAEGIGAIMEAMIKTFEFSK